jgi:hypothetical protein
VSIEGIHLSIVFNFNHSLEFSVKSCQNSQNISHFLREKKKELQGFKCWSEFNRVYKNTHLNLLKKKNYRGILAILWPLWMVPPTNPEAKNSTYSKVCSLTCKKKKKKGSAFWLAARENRKRKRKRKGRHHDKSN